MTKKEVDISKVTLFKFRIVGMGSELAWMELDKEQITYWRNVYSQSEMEIEAQSELIEHIRHGMSPLENEEGYLGEYYNWNDEFEEYPMYDGSKLIIDLYSGENGDAFLETIEVSLDDERLSKSFFDGYTQTTSERKSFTKGTVFAKTEDRGEYCIGQLDISNDGNEFSLHHFNLSVEKIQGCQYVSMLEYNEELLDYVSASDPHNKDFNAWIIWE